MEVVSDKFLFGSNLDRLTYPFVYLRLSISMLFKSDYSFFGESLLLVTLDFEISSS